MQLDDDHEKRKQNHAEILDIEHPTYTVNTLKLEYLGPCIPRSAHIFSLAVWR